LFALALAAFLGLFWASGSATAHGGPALPITEYNSVAKVSVSLSLKRDADGTLHARAVYHSGQPKCIAPKNIHFGHELTPELYYFTFPETVLGEVPNNQFKLKLSGPATYELTLPGSTMILGPPRLSQRPVSEITSVNFLASINEAAVTVKKRGKTEVVKCLRIEGPKGTKVYRY
jgi:hypothetical protein